MTDFDCVPTWPGRPDLLPAYSAGWDTYSDFYLRCCDDGRPAVADPDDYVPRHLADGTYHAWCMGWLECMSANSAINRARAAGVTADMDLWRIAVTEVEAIRARYLHGYRPMRLH
jgi:hypothetical protein